MELRLTRTHQTPEFTSGILQNGETILCHTLEPGLLDATSIPPPLRRTEGVFEGGGEGSKGPIPEGRYQIVFRHSPHFNRVMPYLENVPGFTAIMIHPGNTTQDTRGCILVGRRHEPADNGRLVNSRRMFQILEEFLLSATDDIYITVH